MLKYIDESFHYDTVYVYCINYAALVQDSVIDQLHELIFEYLNIHAHTVGFPELALPILMEVHNIHLAVISVSMIY